MNYFRVWENRHSPFVIDDCAWRLAMEFSPQYFAKLRRELEESGYEVAHLDEHTWFSPPIGYFSINARLENESFVFLLM
jgi:hypothetical protein